MSQYHETRRFKCTSDAGNACVVIEQIRIADEAVAGPRTDYMTVDGEVANRLDKKHFLILMKGEIVKIQRALRKKH